MYFKLAFFFIFLFSFSNTLLAQKNTGHIKFLQVKHDSDSLSAGTMAHYSLFYKEKEITYMDLQDRTPIPAKVENGEMSLVVPGGKGMPKVYSYQNLTTKTLKFAENFAPGSKLSVVDNMSPISWKLSKNTKKIQNIQCFSAQAEYRGRVWTAWYAPSIPISSGPWLLYGLPGMILEAEDLSKTVKFICEGVIIPSENVEVSEPKSNSSDGKFINGKDLPKIVKEKLENTAKLMSDKSMSLSFGVSSIEIFDFEKDIATKRFQQKLSNTPKK